MKNRGKDSYGEIARRHVGQPATAARAARRRSEDDKDEAPARGEAGGLTTDLHPEDVTARALQVGALPGRLGVPAVGGEGLRRLRERTDDHVGHVAPVLGGLLRTVPPVCAIARTSPAAQEARIAQRTEMLLLRGTAAQLRRDALDSRRQTSGAVREGMGALAALLHEALRPRAGATPEEREAQAILASDAQEFLGAWERVKQDPVAEQQKTLSAGAQAIAAVAAQAEESAYLETVIALRRGEPVDPEAWDRAAARHDADADADGRERRGRGR